MRDFPTIGWDPASSGILPMNSVRSGLGVVEAPFPCMSTALRWPGFNRSCRAVDVLKDQRDGGLLIEAVYLACARSWIRTEFHRGNGAIHLESLAYVLLRRLWMDARTYSIRFDVRLSTVGDTSIGSPYFTVAGRPKTSMHGASNASQASRVLKHNVAGPSVPTKIQ
ncbi:hypothetical protein MKEN_00186000 [Mycena kentingensis (nom. inval.)]|nr:hypothetical protein MKEN_00186000 [Mycena kentingensis (nom. inval.)]